MPRLIPLLTAAAIMTAAAPAQAKQVQYVGTHPIVADAGGGYCYIEAPHVHVWAPARAELTYRQHDGAYFFVGDPVAHGFDGPKHAYYGHHPVAVDVVVGEEELDGDEVEYCYLE